MIEGFIGIVALIGVLGFAVTVWLFPCVIAAKRGVSREDGRWVLILTIGLGWTGIGWLLALVMACVCRPGQVDYR